MAREVWEETGLRVRSERLVGWYERTGFRPHRSPVYACTEAGGQLRRSREAVAVGFFPVERLPLSLFPWYREIIRDAVEGRSHAGPRGAAPGPGHGGDLRGDPSRRGDRGVAPLTPAGTAREPLRLVP